MRCLPATAVLACALLSAGCSDGFFFGPQASPGPRENFEILWRDFDQHYAFFVDKNIDWQAVHDEYAPRITTSTSAPELYRLITEMLLRLQDIHVTLVAPGIGAWSYDGWWRNSPANYNEQAAHRYLRPGITRGREGHVYHGTTAQGIGYIRIRDFAGAGWVADIDRAVAALYDAPGLIVDVRDNGGGTDLLSDPIAGRFADRKRLVERVRYRNGPAHDQFTDWMDRYIEPAGARRFTKPVVVLTNRRVVSTAEAFVLSLRALPHVTVVGDTTAGGSGNPIARELPNGWSFRLSRWQTVTPEGASYEGVGLAPDVPVWITEAQAREGRDTILERAIALLTGAQ
jgi:hypothetical protein